VARLAHCGQVAPSRRSATEIGVRPSVVEPTRTSAALAVDAECCPRQSLESLLRNRLAAVRADAVRVVLDALQRGLDLGEDVL
jgi:hypothetical protein